MDTYWLFLLPVFVEGGKGIWDEHWHEEEEDKMEDERDLRGDAVGGGKGEGGMNGQREVDDGRRACCNKHL